MEVVASTSSDFSGALQLLDSPHYRLERLQLSVAKRKRTGIRLVVDSWVRMKFMIDDLPVLFPYDR